MLWGYRVLDDALCFAQSGSVLSDISGEGGPECLGRDIAGCKAHGYNLLSDGLFRWFWSSGNCPGAVLLLELSQDVGSPLCIVLGALEDDARSRFLHFSSIWHFEVLGGEFSTPLDCGKVDRLVAVMVFKCLRFVAFGIWASSSPRSFRYLSVLLRILSVCGRRTSSFLMCWLVRRIGLVPHRHFKIFCSPLFVAGRGSDATL